MTPPELFVGSDALLVSSGGDWQWAEDVRTQAFAEAPASPGGREWEAKCARERITHLEAIVKFNTQELERERARLAYLEGESA